jgi:uncharacterized protein (TIGR02598 family)
MDKTSLLLPRRNRSGGFSLVEVALAIGIIAFAFVALFALIPTGLTTFRSAIDNSNETWIMQGMNSMVQTTDFANVKKLSFESSGEIYYYDEEARFTDTLKIPTTDPKVIQTRLYQVKLLVDDMYRPNGDDKTPTSNGDGRYMSHGWRVIVLIAPLQDPTANTQFEKVINARSLQDLPADSRVHSRTFYVARMDTQPLTTAP